MGGGTVRLVWVDARLGLYGRRHGEACMGGVTVRLVWASPLRHPHQPCPISHIVTSKWQTVLLFFALQYLFCKCFNNFSYKTYTYRGNTMSRRTDITCVYLQSL